MTRKDYILLAGALKAAGIQGRTWSEERSAGYSDGIEQATAEIAQALAEENPNFNRSLFLQACTGQVALNARKAV